MSSTRRAGVGVAVVAALVVAALGVTSAIAQQDDDEPEGRDPAALLERLDALERQLPADPTEFELDRSDLALTGVFTGDAAGTRGVLDTLEPDLRRLYVDADETGGSVGEAVAEVTRGWLDLWHGLSALADAEGHDLAFPVATFDEDGVATGADELDGVVETGLTLLLDGRARHLVGYTSLRELGEAEGEAQARLDGRAAAAEEFDRDLRPVLRAALSQEGPTVLVAVERFDTDAPGVEPRAASLELVCVDRDALEEAGGVATPEVVAQIQAGASDRADCPGLPTGDVVDPDDLDD